MNMENTFSQPVVKTQVDTSRDPNAHGNDIVHEEKVDIPLSLFAKSKKEPYTRTFFGLPDYINVDPRLDVDRVVEKSYEIEDFIVEKVHEWSMEDSIDSYKKIMRELEKQVGVIDGEESNSRFHRIHQYIKLLREIKSFKERRRMIKDSFSTDL